MIAMMTRMMAPAIEAITTASTGTCVLSPSDFGVGGELDGAGVLGALGMSTGVGGGFEGVGGGGGADGGAEGGLVGGGLRMRVVIGESSVSSSITEEVSMSVNVDSMSETIPSASDMVPPTVTASISMMVLPARILTCSCASEMPMASAKRRRNRALLKE